MTESTAAPTTKPKPKRAVKKIVKPAPVPPNTNTYLQESATFTSEMKHRLAAVERDMATLDDEIAAIKTTAQAEIDARQQRKADKAAIAAGLRGALIALGEPANAEALFEHLAQHTEPVQRITMIDAFEMGQPQ